MIFIVLYMVIMGKEGIGNRIIRFDLIHYPSLKNLYFIEEIDETKVLLYEMENTT